MTHDWLPADSDNQGVVVYVPRGVKHKAIGDGKLTVLAVCIPRGVLDDVHEVE